MTFRTPRLAAALLAGLPLGAVAGGFQNLPPSAYALGLAGAVTATSRDASCAWFNPGALGMLDSANVSIGLTALSVRRAFRSSTTNQTARTAADPAYAPYLYVALPVDLARRLMVALAVNSPFGYDTKWPADWQGRALVRESRIRTLFVQPTAAYRVSDKFSIGAGVVFAGADLRVDRTIGEFADAAAQYEASGNGIGWNVGVKGRAGDAVAFGLAYRSAVKVKMTNGTATFSGVPASQAFRFPVGAAFGTTVQLPWQLTAGISNAVTEKLQLNFSFELSGWSAYDSLNIVYTDQVRPTERGGRRYDDAMAFRVGADYQYSAVLALRAGVYYDESPVRDQNITADLPDANVLGACAGVGYRLGRHLQLDAAYTFGASATRNSVNNPTALGVPAIAGQFRHLQHGGALNVSYQF
ncbi:MAG: outer membrane protein transport protein [Hymenobacteraceae bacterium]|nr:outer membrane protein transport protein [Hymenobacteraceae bacterium]